jgi:hypothetical protein
MSAGYTWEKFFLAIDGLVVSGEPLQERLANAYVYHLMHAENDGLPEDIAEDFKKLSDSLRRVTATGTEGNVMASARSLNELEARELLHLIVSMYDRVAKHGPNAR